MKEPHINNYPNMIEAIRDNRRIEIHLSDKHSEENNEPCYLIRFKKLITFDSESRERYINMQSPNFILRHREYSKYAIGITQLLISNTALMMLRQMMDNLAYLKISIEEMENTVILPIKEEQGEPCPYSLEINNKEVYCDCDEFQRNECRKDI